MNVLDSLGSQRIADFRFLRESAKHARLRRKGPPLFFDLIVSSMHLVNLKLLGHLVLMVEQYGAMIKGLALIQFRVLES